MLPARVRKPQFDMLTDFPIVYAAGLGQWDQVDRLRNAVPKEIRRGEHSVQSDQLVNLLELFFRPSPNRV